MTNHALVFGASGITGWAIVKAILDGYPSKDAFESVTAMTNRPLSVEDALWSHSPKLDIVSGVNLLTTKGQEGLEAELVERVPHIREITHVYFFAYIFDSDSEKEIATNVELLDRAIKTVDKLSPKLKFVVLPSGTKAYGVHLLDKFPFSNDLPLKETLPRIPEPFASQMFYYNQIDTLASMCKGKSWTWCEVIPDMVIGFVPNNNAYCLAQVLSTYLSLYAEINGKGSEVAFPGTEKSYTILSNDSSQDILAKASIYASLHPEVSAAQRYNVADNATPSTWEVKWPVICEYFGLKGVGPPPGGSGPQPSQYLLDHLTEWQALEKEYGLKGGRVGNDISVNGYAHFLMTLFDFDRHLDMTKLHGMMGDAKMETDAKGTWWTAFDRFRKANIIP